MTIAVFMLVKDSPVYPDGKGTLFFLSTSERLSSLEVCLSRNDRERESRLHVPSNDRFATEFLH